MKILSMLGAAVLALGNPFHRTATPSRRVREQADWSDCGNPQSNKDDGLPRGYPGAKLARKAVQKAVAVKHPRGLRLDGVTV